MAFYRGLQGYGKIFMGRKALKMITALRSFPLNLHPVTLYGVFPCVLYKPIRIDKELLKNLVNIDTGISGVSELQSTTTFVNPCFNECPERGKKSP